MLTENGFDERYFHHCKSSKTYVEAYAKTELEFFKYYELNKLGRTFFQPSNCLTLHTSASKVHSLKLVLL